MSKKIEFDGEVHEFPDDASDEDIRSALEKYTPTVNVGAKAESFGNVGTSLVEKATNPLDKNALGNAARGLAGKIRDVNDKNYSGSNPLHSKVGDKLATAYSGAATGALEGVGDFADSMTSPASLVAMLLSGGESALASKLPGASRLLAAGSKLAGAGFGAQGGRTALHGAEELKTDPWKGAEHIAGGGAQAILGLLGLAGDTKVGNAPVSEAPARLTTPLLDVGKKVAENPTLQTLSGGAIGGALGNLVHHPLVGMGAGAHLARTGGAGIGKILGDVSTKLKGTYDHSGVMTDLNDPAMASTGPEVNPTADPINLDTVGRDHPGYDVKAGKVTNQMQPDLNLDEVLPGNHPSFNLEVQDPMGSLDDPAGYAPGSIVDPLDPGASLDQSRVIKEAHDAENHLRTTTDLQDPAEQLGVKLDPRVFDLQEQMPFRDQTGALVSDEAAAEIGATRDRPVNSSVDENMDIQPPGELTLEDIINNADKKRAMDIARRQSLHR